MSQKNFVLLKFLFLSKNYFIQNIYPLAILKYTPIILCANCESYFFDKTSKKTETKKFIKKTKYTFSQLSETIDYRKIIKYSCRVIDIHGADSLRKDNNKKYSLSLNEEIVHQVLLYGQSMASTAI